MLGLVLLYVGAVLFINALAMLGKIAPKEAAIMNVFTGAIAFLVGIFNMATFEPALIQSCAYGLLFAFTYLWVAYNNLTDQDGRGLGWFSFFVSVTAICISYDSWLIAENSGLLSDYWLFGCWVSWTVLWGLFFVFGVLQKLRLVRFVAYFTLLTAIFSAWIPGYLLLSNRMPDSFEDLKSMIGL